MESLVRRLKYYGIGFGLGTVFVFFFFKNRGCSWLPENRVKNSILDRLVVVSEETSKEMKELGIKDKDIIYALNDGDVLFGESDKDNESKVYVIERNNRKFYFTLPYESFVSEVKFGYDAKKIKTSTDGMGTILRFPMDSTLVYPDSTDLITCQLNKLDLVGGRDVLKLFKESGRVNFAKCNLTIRPKPEHYIEFKKDSLDLAADLVWYKNKLNVTNFHIPNDTLCK